MRIRFPLLLLTLLLLAGPLAPAAVAGEAASPTVPPAAADSSGGRLPGTLEFTPASAETLTIVQPLRADSAYLSEEEWLAVGFGDQLLTEPEEWRARHGRPWRLDPLLDYNRVDPLRLGLAGEIQRPTSMAPRFGGRLEYATGRRRWLYGAQLEQPLLPRGRVAIGVSATRRTDHSELEQVDDLENSLALLLARQDYRDYFEREGYGAYLAWRVPDFSEVSLHWRTDRFRSLPLYVNTRSWLLRDRPLRANPAIDEGTARSVILRLAREARRTAQTRAGLYHEIEIEQAGGALGGDFHYTRALADVRSVLRLSPANTLVLRAVGGYTLAGDLPAEKLFTLGGVDGMRAHANLEYRGDQLLLGQAEYTTALWHVRTRAFETGLHALVFVDAGQAWYSDVHSWDPQRQRLMTDGGIGFATGEDHLRLYVARDLQQARASAIVTLRLQRPF